MAGVDLHTSCCCFEGGFEDAQAGLRQKSEGEGGIHAGIGRYPGDSKVMNQIAKEALVDV